MTELRIDHLEVGGSRKARYRAAHRLGANRKERAMKLNSAQLERTLGQFEARAIPDDHPVIPQLNDLFGEHTFFLDRNGLNIVEPASSTAMGSISSSQPRPPPGRRLSQPRS